MKKIILFVLYNMFLMCLIPACSEDPPLPSSPGEVVLPILVEVSKEEVEYLTSYLPNNMNDTIFCINKETDLNELINHQNGKTVSLTIDFANYTFLMGTIILPNEVCKIGDYSLITTGDNYWEYKQTFISPKNYYTSIDIFHFCKKYKKLPVEKIKLTHKIEWE